METGLSKYLECLREFKKGGKMNMKKCKCGSKMMHKNMEMENGGKMNKKMDKKM